jgi:CheY-like chemotaxis protein
MLSDWHMKAVAADSPEGADALARTGEHAFEIVLADVHDGAGGTCSFSNIREMVEGNLHVVAMVPAGEKPGIGEECIKGGADAFLRKPVKGSELLEILISIANRKQHPSGILQEPVPEEAPAGPLHILLVEDNLVNQKVVVRMLEKLGHSMIIANDGFEAKDTWQKEKYDLILMDVLMPRMDGYEATMSIRSAEQESGGHIPIIALTANVIKEDIEHCYEAGMDGYIAKPAKLATLVEEMHRVLSNLA